MSKKAVIIATSCSAYPNSDDKTGTWWSPDPLFALVLRLSDLLKTSIEPIVELLVEPPADLFATAPVLEVGQKVLADVRVMS